MVDQYILYINVSMLVMLSEIRHYIITVFRFLISSISCIVRMGHMSFDCILLRWRVNIYGVSMRVVGFDIICKPNIVSLFFQ